MNSLYCPICKNATIREHPEADNKEETIFNQLYKCTHCSYTVDMLTHDERAKKMSVCDYKKPRKPFGKGEKYV